MPVADAGQGLVDGVVDDLPQAVHETALVGRADVHARALAHGLEALEDLEVARGVVAVAGGSRSGGGWPRVSIFFGRESASGRAAEGWQGKPATTTADGPGRLAAPADAAHGPGMTSVPKDRAESPTRNDVMHGASQRPSLIVGKHST